jgi:hypothetical protein
VAMQPEASLPALTLSLYSDAKRDREAGARSLTTCSDLQPKICGKF